MCLIKTKPVVWKCIEWVIATLLVSFLDYKFEFFLTVCRKDWRGL
jgi:hypothetical protein